MISARIYSSFFKFVLSWKKLTCSERNFIIVLHVTILAMLLFSNLYYQKVLLYSQREVTNREIVTQVVFPTNLFKISRIHGTFHKSCSKGICFLKECLNSFTVIITRIGFVRRCIFFNRTPLFLVLGCGLDLCNFRAFPG